MRARVSIILPAFNAAETIASALESIRAQRFASWELIVIDDGSADRTAEIARGIAEHDPRIRVLPRPHAGIVGALNAGLAAAAGEFIARMDADDTSHPDRLVEQVRMLDDNSGLGLVSCLVDFAGDRVANAGYALHVDWINSIVTADAVAVNRFVESPFAHPSVLFRRTLLAEHGGYREGDFPEDYELWLRWLDAGVRMAKVPKTLVSWRDSPRRLSRVDPRYAVDRFFALKARWIAAELKRQQGDRRVWVWGAGRPTRQRAAQLLAHGITIAGYIDVDRKKIGRSVGGKPVRDPASMPPRAESFVLGYVASRGARDLIRRELDSRDYVEGTDYLMCA